MTDYIVTLTFRHPPWDEREGIPFYVVAGSKAEAIKYARSEAMRDGHIPAVGKGRYSFRATEEAR